MIKKQSLKKNTFAVSVMYDAVFFAVMVSLSGVILLPAMYMNMAVETSVEKHREETVDEALLMLMTSRDADFGYMFAGEQVKTIIPDEFLFDEQGEETFLYTIVDTLIGKQQKHKTYADLIVEDLATQLQVFDFRLNVFTTDYDTSIKNNITEVLEEYLGGKYRFNLTSQWHPIGGVPFGGSMYVGPHPPEDADTHVATCMASMPETPFSDFWFIAEDFIEENLNDPDLIALLERDAFEENVTNIINETLYAILFDGFGEDEDSFPGVVNATINYVFGKIEDSLEALFDEAMSAISDSIDVMGVDFDDGLTQSLLGNFSSFTGIDFGEDIGLGDALGEVKTYAVNMIKEFLKEPLEAMVEIIVTFIMELFDASSFIIEEAVTMVNDFLMKRVNVLRARFTLTIWEATA